LRTQRPAGVIGHSERRAVIAHQWLAGDTLRELTAAGTLTTRHLVDAARALARFHSGPRDKLPLPDPGAQANVIASLAAQIGFLLPDLRSGAARTATALTAWLANQQPVYLPVHGDFYDKQVVIRSSGAALIDMDEARLDDPLVDLGNYAAHLERGVISTRVSRAQYRQHLGALLSGYESELGAVPGQRFRHYFAIGLLRLALQPFRDFEASWPENIRHILWRIEDLIDGGDIL
jgi:aminoglycoside phosphotransferase (APT) family kinase protein